MTLAHTLQKSQVQTLVQSLKLLKLLLKVTFQASQQSSKLLPRRTKYLLRRWHKSSLFSNHLEIMATRKGGFFLALNTHTEIEDYMKNKLLVTGMTLSLAVLSVSCSDHYQEGIDAGKTEGYKSGYDVGYTCLLYTSDAAGYARGQTYFSTKVTFADGFTDGRAEGVTVGYNNGYAVGFAQTQPGAYAQGY